MIPRAVTGALLALLLLLGCEDRLLLEGVDQPLRAHGAQFVLGDLPGFEPIRVGSDETSRPPTTSASTADVAYLQQRLSGVRFSGLADPTAVAVALRFVEHGDGYWLVPTGGADPQANGRLGWAFVVSFGADLPAGRHALRVVAIDDQGRAGTQAEANFCIHSLIPDNGNACFAMVEPPALVVSLGWDTPVDLDLKLVTPSGQVIESKRPASGPTDMAGTIDWESPGSGFLNADSNRDCRIDGRQRESIVFQRLPPPGRYAIYASLNRACGEHAVSYLATFHVPTRLDGGARSTRARTIGAGSLVAAQASGDTTLGTFVGNVQVR